MLSAPFNFDWNSFRFSNFAFIQMSSLNFKFIQLRSFLQFPLIFFFFWKKSWKYFSIINWIFFKIWKFWRKKIKIWTLNYKIWWIDLNWMNLKLIGHNWMKAKLKDLNEFWSNLEVHFAFFIKIRLLFYA